MSVRKLSEYARMQRLGIERPLHIRIFQTASVKGVDASDTSDREEECIDKIAHQDVTDALMKMVTVTQLIAVLCKNVTAKHNDCKTESRVTSRNLVLTEMSLRTLLNGSSSSFELSTRSWMSFENLDLTTDRLWIPPMDYADDVIILEKTKEEVE